MLSASQSFYTPYHPLQHNGGLIDGISEGDIWSCDRTCIYPVAVAWNHMWLRCSTWLTLPQYVQCSHPEFVGGAWNVEWKYNREERWPGKWHLTLVIPLLISSWKLSHATLAGVKSHTEELAWPKKTTAIAWFWLFEDCGSVNGWFLRVSVFWAHFDWSRGHTCILV